MGVWGTVKQWVKDSIVGATSTHGGVGGGTASAEKQRRKKPKK
jgi:hypothetical protein